MHENNRKIAECSCRKPRRRVTEEDADGAHARRHAVVHVRQHEAIGNVQGAAAAENKVFPDNADLQQIRYMKREAT
jgi:hypothetical protein